MTTKVHAITCAKMFPQFVYTFADRIAVAEISGFQAFQTDKNPGLGPFVA